LPFIGEPVKRRRDPSALDELFRNARRSSPRANTQRADIRGERKLIMRVAIFCAALGLVLCTAGIAGPEAAAPKTHIVNIEGLKFQPQVLTVAVGDVVVWVNKDLVAHTATSSKAGVFDSKMIAPDKTWTLTVRTKGEFGYSCTYHPTMKGTLRVE
jgi:plastocyanin